MQTKREGFPASLGGTYFIWLRHHRSAAPPAPDTLSERQRYCLLALLAVVALAIAVPFAANMATHFHGYLAFRVFVFRIGIYTTAAFIPLLALLSLVLNAVHRRTPRKLREYPTIASNADCDTKERRFPNRRI